MQVHFKKKYHFMQLATPSLVLGLWRLADYGFWGLNLELPSVKHALQFLEVFPLYPNPKFLFLRARYPPPQLFSLLSTDSKFSKHVL